MPAFFATLNDLIANALSSHFGQAQADKIISNQEVIRGQLAELLDAESARARAAESAAADLVAIKTFLGIPDARILTSQTQVDTVGSQIKQASDAIQKFDETLPGAV